MADTGPSASNVLVVWSSAGRRLQFSRQDLVMPEHILNLPNHDFFKKQWDKVAGIWLNRVLKESALQRMQVSDIVQLIEKDIQKRWEHRKAEKTLYKKKKRLLTEDGPAGKPSSQILLTNVCSLSQFSSLSDADRADLIMDIVKHVETVCKGNVQDVRVMISDDPPQQGDERSSKKVVIEKDDQREVAEEQFDDRVAVVCGLESKERAALAIANLHRSRFDGRTVFCCFHELPNTLEGR